MDDDLAMSMFLTRDDQEQARAALHVDAAGAKVTRLVSGVELTMKTEGKKWHFAAQKVQK